MKTDTHKFSIKSAFLALLLLCAQAVSAQTTVTGTVLDELGEAVLGATVRERGTQTGAATDIDGHFSLKVKSANATLSVSYVGYKTANVALAGKTNITVRLTPDAQMLDETVVVGYGRMKKSDLAGASTTLDDKALKEGNLTNIDQAFQGRVAGVSSVQTSGAPGSSTSIRVRGQATINAGAEPLYVIDGVIFQGSNAKGQDLGLGDRLGNGSVSTVSPLATINPSDIVSMEILKDASATAIYGAQGANGVVLITTKRGKAGEAKITYDGSVTMSRQMKRIDLLNLREFAGYYNSLVDMGELAQPDPMYSDPSVLGVGTNWQDAVFQTAWQHNHQLSVQGGTDAVKYYISGNYMNQEGTIIGSKFQRYGARANIDAQLKKWLKIGLNAAYSATNDDLKHADAEDGLITYSLNTPPDIPIYNIDGSYSSVSKEGFTNPNPIAMAELNEILLDRQKLNGSVFADISFLKNLVWHAEFGWDLSWSKGSTYEPMVDLGTWKRSNNESRIQKNSSTYWTIKNYLTWNQQFGRHSVTAMLGQEAWKSKYDFVSANNTALPSDVVHNPALGAGDPKIGAGFSSTSMASFFTRETYNYDDRYLLTYTYRYDGSSNFGPNQRWASFHSVAGAWRFSNEKFMKDATWLSNGKLRVGWGQTGNSNIGGYKWGSSMSVMASALGTSYRPANMKNLDIKWETQEQINIGLDLGFFNNRLGLTVDWYRKMSKDMLMQLNLPSIMGTGGNSSSALAAPYGNYGDIQNTGLEISLTAHPVQGKFQWDTELNFSINRNKLKSLYGTSALQGYGQWTDVVSLSREGESLYNFYGYDVVGVYKDFQDILSSPVNTIQQNNPVLKDADGKVIGWDPDPTKYSRSNTTFVGDLKYRDVNHDGIIDENDKTDIGSPMPKFTFGFNNTFRYQGFDLTVFINGSIGNKVGNYTRMKISHMNSAWQNQCDYVNDRAILAPADGVKGANWFNDVNNVRVINPDCTEPRASINDPNDNDCWSSRYIEDGSYVRLKSLTLGYTFPAKLVTRWGLSNLRLSLNASNLLTITGYDGYDPEIGVSTTSQNVYGLDNGRYPAPTSFTFGLNVAF